jgi:hypothetical protein
MPQIEVGNTQHDLGSHPQSPKGSAILAGTADSAFLSPSYDTQRGFIPAAIPTKQREVGARALDQFVVVRIHVPEPQPQCIAV